MRGTGEHVDLAAGIIDIIFADHLVPGIFQQGGERVAHHCAAAMAHMHGTGGIGRDIFDVHGRARAEIGPAIVGGLGMDRRQFRPPGRVGQGQVDEAGAGDAGYLHLIQRLQLGHDRVGQRARIGAGGLGQHHRGVGGQVAMAGIARRLHRHRLAVEAGGQRAFSLQRVEHGIEMGGETGVKGHGHFLQLRSR